MAILAAFSQNRAEGQSLDEYLQERIFADAEGTVLSASPEEAAGFERFMERYKAGLSLEKAAIAAMNW